MADTTAMPIVDLKDLVIAGWHPEFEDLAPTTYIPRNNLS